MLSWNPIISGGAVTRSPKARQPGTRLARCARRLGFDRNPLRRRTDRVEAAIRLATLILLLVAVPIVAVAHSPTPSTVRIAVCPKGEQKNALAACAM